jgi:hypothetical protein
MESFSFGQNTQFAQTIMIEVALGKNYNGACDVYSFCILFWEMLALKQPFLCYTVKTLKERAWSDMEKRPLMDESWSEPIQSLLNKGWSNDWTIRPAMDEVEEMLRKECMRVRDGDSTGLEHQRRRSTFVFDQKNEKEKAEEAPDTPPSSSGTQKRVALNGSTGPLIVATEC